MPVQEIREGYTVSKQKKTSHILKSRNVLLLASNDLLPRRCAEDLYCRQLVWRLRSTLVILTQVVSPKYKPRTRHEERLAAPSEVTEKRGSGSGKTSTVSQVMALITHTNENSKVRSPAQQPFTALPSTSLSLKGRGWPRPTSLGGLRASLSLESIYPDGEKIDEGAPPVFRGHSHDTRVSAPRTSRKKPAPRVIPPTL